MAKQLPISHENRTTNSTLKWRRVINQHQSDSYIHLLPKPLIASLYPGSSFSNWRPPRGQHPFCERCIRTSFVVCLPPGILWLPNAIIVCLVTLNWTMVIRFLRTRVMNRIATKIWLFFDQRQPELLLNLLSCRILLCFTSVYVPVAASMSDHVSLRMCECVCMSFVYACLCMCLSICLFASACLSVCICLLSVCVCLFVFLFVCVCLSFRLCVSACLSVSVCLSVYLFVRVSISRIGIDHMHRYFSQRISYRCLLTPSIALRL